MLLVLQKNARRVRLPIFSPELIFEVHSGSRSPPAAAGLAAGGELLLQSRAAALGWSAAAWWC